MLARFGALVEPEVRAAPSKIISDLKNLHVARIALVKDRTAAENREKNLTSPLLKRHVRQALYMPALVAARFNPDLKDKYQEFTALGKPPKVALTAIMKKLVILANALIRDDREWSPRMT